EKNVALDEAAEVIAAEVPDRSVIRILLRDGRVLACVNDQVARNVAGLRWVDAPEMADAIEVLRVLAGADVDVVVVNDRRADEVAPRPLAAQLVFAVLWIGVEFPDQATGLRFQPIQPAIAARKNDLPLPLDDGVGRVRPLPVHDRLARQVAL